MLRINDEDLLATILGTGIKKREVAERLVREHGGIGGLSRATARELSQGTGMGSARAARVFAAFELGRRAIHEQPNRSMINRPKDVFDLISPRVVGLQQEVFFVLGIDVRNSVLDVVEVARGSVAEVIVHPREVFRPLIRMAAAGVVLAHNHPTGDATPSAEDIELTKRLREIGDLVGIPVVDHVVIGATGFRSIAEWVGASL